MRDASWYGRMFGSRPLVSHALPKQRNESKERDHFIINGRILSILFERIFIHISTLASLLLVSLSRPFGKRAYCRETSEQQQQQQRKNEKKEEHFGWWPSL